MKSYITKPKSIKIKSNYSLSARDYRVLSSSNKNVKILKDIIVSEFQWKEIWSDGYLTQSRYRFLKTGNIWKHSILLDTGNIEYCFPVNQKHPKDGDILIAKDGGWDGLWDVILYKKSLEYVDTISAGIHCVTPESKNRYYILWLLKTQFFKNFVDLNTAWWSIIRHAKKIALEFPLPFPTIKNHPHPEKVEEYISLLVQNMIDKEEQIRVKNEEMDKRIEVEFWLEQKTNPSEYRFPKISEILNEGRWDTGIYERKYQRMNLMVRNYRQWFINFENSWFTRKKGPNLAISVIGKSFYSDKKLNSNFRQLILSKNVTDEGWLKSAQYIWSNAKLPVLKKFDFLLFARWDIWRVILIDDCLVGATSNFDVFFISSSKEYWENIFLLCYLKYLRNIWFWQFYWVGGSWASSLTDYFFKKVNIPNFPDSKKQEIARLYYNPIPENIELTLENYLEREKIRNSEVGIFQLNMEIFALREKLEETIDRIVMEEEIDLIF